MSEAVAGLQVLAGLEPVAAAGERVRAAVTLLRWHQALRRRIPEAAAESRIRGAWASAELDGAKAPLDLVRDVMRGARPRSVDPDPTESTLYGAIAATAATETLAARVTATPRQVLARLHLAAAAGLLPAADLGRPRHPGQGCAEFAGLGPAPAAQVVASRLAALDDIIRARGVPVFLVASIAHAEIAHVRPFVRGNGLVARAMERAVVLGAGLDPTGVAVPEFGHARAGTAAYQGALAAYGRGTQAGVLLWLEHCAQAWEAAAAEGTAIADAVLAGRIG